MKAYQVTTYHLSTTRCMKKMWEADLKYATEYSKTHKQEDYDVYKLEKHIAALKEGLAFFDREAEEERKISQIDDINITCAKFYPGWGEKPVIKHRGFFQRLKAKLFGQARQRQ